MTSLLCENAFFAIFLTLSAFEAGRVLQQKTKLALLNPILVGAVLVGVVLVVLGIPLERYQADCKPLQYLLTPATICYSVSLYEQIGTMKKQLPAIFAGVLAGTVTSLLSIRVMCMAFGLDAVMTNTLLPKSITTAIGMALSQEVGGIAALTTAVIIISGILGNMFGPALNKILALKHPVAQGVAFGTASHAVGTAKANEISALTGAVSSLSLTLAGLITVVLFSFITM